MLPAALPCCRLARALAARKEAPKRTVLFVLFGSEETGGQGNGYFLQHPPVPLKNIVANLEFEMIGRPDAAVKPDELWLTGFERSNLGPELAKHGAKLVADPHPQQHFFQRSDNYALAGKAWLLKPSPALACMPTITARAMTWPISISHTWNKQFNPWSDPWCGWRIRTSSRSG